MNGPGWKYQVSRKYQVSLVGVWRNLDMTFEQRRDEIVRRLRASRWFKDAGHPYTLLHQLVEELSDAKDTEAFNSAWEAISNEADADRARIALTQ